MGKNIFDLSGRVAIVTGGGSGLGRAFCEGLAEFGADVACIGRTEKSLKETAALISQYGHKAVAIQADVSRPEQVDYMVKETVARLGAIDILINNAGITATPSKLAETPVEVWEKMISIDLTGVFLCMRAVIPVMAKQKRGSIINISSIGAFGASPDPPTPAAYGPSKAGVISLTMIGAVENARDGIRVNCIAPGMHDTGLGTLPDPVLEKARKQLFQNMIDKAIPMGRQAEPEELKGLAVYLASDASSFVTGQVFIQDGGQRAQM
jgi:NAD(P)-dependent dehydrogenase (short-subunit alcohol dehydrogenase family)